MLDTYILQEFRTLWSPSIAYTFFSYITFSAVYLLKECRTIIAGLGIFRTSVSLTVDRRLLPLYKTLTLIYEVLEEIDCYLHNMLSTEKNCLVFVYTRQHFYWIIVSVALKFISLKTRPTGQRCGVIFLIYVLVHGIKSLRNTVLQNYGSQYIMQDVIIKSRRGHININLSKTCIHICECT